MTPETGNPELELDVLWQLCLADKSEFGLNSVKHSVPPVVITFIIGPATHFKAYPPF